MRRSLRYLPNGITLFALACGCSALHFVYERNLAVAEIAILAAVILDVSDGVIARRLRLETAEGVQLDSLADLVNFGVAPAFLIYESHGVGFGAIGAVASLAYVIATCTRLARYNVAAEPSRDERIPITRHYSGMPSTAAAMASLIAMRVSSHYDAGELAITSQFVLAAVMLAPWPFPKLATVLNEIIRVSKFKYRR